MELPSGGALNERCDTFTIIKILTMNIAIFLEYSKSNTLGPNCWLSEAY